MEVFLRATKTSQMVAGKKYSKDYTNIAIIPLASYLAADKDNVALVFSVNNIASSGTINSDE